MPYDYGTKNVLVHWGNFKNIQGICFFQDDACQVKGQGTSSHDQGRGTCAPADYLGDRKGGAKSAKWALTDSDCPLAILGEVSALPL